MKQENLDWIAGFLGGIIATMVVIYLFSFLPHTNTETEKYNAYTGEEICIRNCNKYNSTAIHTWSYIDDRWHCSCESEGEVALLW